LIENLLKLLMNL